MGTEPVQSELLHAVSTNIRPLAIRLSRLKWDLPVFNCIYEGVTTTGQFLLYQDAPKSLKTLLLHWTLGFGVSPSRLL